MKMYIYMCACISMWADVYALRFLIVEHAHIGICKQCMYKSAVHTYMSECLCLYMYIYMQYLDLHIYVNIHVCRVVS